MTRFFSNSGVRHYRRLTRRVPFSHLRKVVGSLYNHQEHPFAKLLCGEGSRLHYLLCK